MGKNSNDPDRYYRTGIAIQAESKPEFERRLGELGLKTAGELVNFFINAEGLVEVMKPHVEPWRAKRKLSSTSMKAERQRAVATIKHMTPEQVAALLKAAEKLAAPTQAD